MIINTFYIDKEKDIEVSLYKIKTEDEIEYIIRTPNHKKGNLVMNLAKVCKTEVFQEENGLLAIKGKIQASLNENNEEVYIFRLNGMKIANIYKNRIEIKVKVPGIIKTLMAQTKEYKIGLKQTLIKPYIFKKLKFRTDLHTHMNANLDPDIMVALGIKNQIQYPLYYIKKLGIALNEEQSEKLMEQRKEVEFKYKECGLVGKYLDRKIDDNTYINFAKLILENQKDQVANLNKVRNSLVILKDGQAVFTNLEKLYIYRYVFAKAKVCKDLIGIKSIKELTLNIEDKEIRDNILEMLRDIESGSKYINNTIRQDKILWIARQYQKQGIYYTEIADTDIVKPGEASIKFLEDIHEILPKIEEDTGVKIRFLGAIRRIPLTIIKDQETSGNYLRESLDTLKQVAKSPYIVGSDFVGEEINDISELQPVIKEIVEYVNKYDEGFCVRIHAGENESLRNNVQNSINAIKESLMPGQKMPRYRLGHGLYTPALTSKEGKKLIEDLNSTNGILEFQLSSNIRLNNLVNLDKHPLKKYLEHNIKCVQGTDGCGFYGTDTVDEELALMHLLKLDENEIMQMRKVEDEIMVFQTKYFKEKSEKFEKFLDGRTIREAFENIEVVENKNLNLRLNYNLDTKVEFKTKIKELPTNKLPIIIAGGSFNSKDMITPIEDEYVEMLKELVLKLDKDKVFFIIGHSMQGYEKTITEIAKDFEVFAILPKTISESVKNRIKGSRITGIRISTEAQEAGIYKSFNYEIFERRNSILIAFDGNSPVSNLVQEANNGKAKSKIFVNVGNGVLEDKFKTLTGYVKGFDKNNSFIHFI